MPCLVSEKQGQAQMSNNSNLLTSAYQIRDTNIVSEVFENDMVILDLESGFYFSLNTSASELWPHITSRQSLSFLQNKVKGLEDFVHSLMEYNLITACEPEPKILLQIRLTDPSNQPNMDVFDDLSDLFMADPIHDTDIDKGWPYIKPEGEV